MFVCATGFVLLVLTGWLWIKEVATMKGTLVLHLISSLWLDGEHVRSVQVPALQKEGMQLAFWPQRLAKHQTNMYSEHQ